MIIVLSITVKESNKDKELNNNSLHRGGFGRPPTDKQLNTRTMKTHIMKKGSLIIGVAIAIMAMFTMVHKAEAQKSSTSVSIDNGVYKYKSRRGSNGLDVEYDGKIVFADDDKSIESISRGGYIRIRSTSVIDLQSALQMLSKREYKTRFMVKIGEHIRSVTTDNIDLFYAEGRNGYIVTNEGKRLIIDYKLETLDEMLDPKKFFRVNRTFIIEINAIKDVLVYSNSRLKVILTQNFDREIIVSREKVNQFKTWFDGEG